MADVAIIVPTLRRPESLERALRSLFSQTGVADRVSAIVVVDNDPHGSAAATVEGLVGADLGRVRRTIEVRARTALVQAALANVPPRLDPDALITDQ